MNEALKVLAHEIGLADPGSTEAFRYAGAEVVGAIGRTASVVRDVAQGIAIP